MTYQKWDFERLFELNPIMDSVQTFCIMERTIFSSKFKIGICSNTWKYAPFNASSNSSNSTRIVSIILWEFVSPLVASVRKFENSERQSRYKAKTSNDFIKSVLAYVGISPKLFTMLLISWPISSAHILKNWIVDL